MKEALNENEKPVSHVSHQKHGESKGNVGLYVDNGTDGYFKNIQIKTSPKE